MPLLFLLFVAVPVIEIALFIQVGGLIGLWPTLAIVILTALAGTTLLRQQGRAALMGLRQSLGELRDPSRPLADGAMIIFAGALLLTPGFFTDACGLALMVPAVRSVIYREISKRVTVVSAETTYRQEPSRDHRVIDGEYEDVTRRAKQDGPSGWTRH